MSDGENSTVCDGGKYSAEQIFSGLRDGQVRLDVSFNKLLLDCYLP